MQQSIFITGAASGIGKATAKLFASRGWFVGLFDVNEAGVRELAAELGPGVAVAGKLDVRNRDDWRSAIAAFGERTGGRMDVLFGCAGVLKFAPFTACTAEEADRQVGINVNGVVNGVYAALPLLEASVGTGKPVIVTMSSASAIYGQPEMAVYSATKFFVRGLTEALDVELGPKGIRVCDVMPGYVDTPMTEATLASVQKHTGRHHDAALASVLAAARQSRLLSPEEVAAEVVRLCREDAAGVNGQAIRLQPGASS